MSGGEATAGRDALPAWLRPLAHLAAGVEPGELSAFLPPADGSARASAVLLLFGDGPRGPDVLLIERSHTLRAHAGQVAFPGGAVDPTDGGPVAAALREAQEETGLLADGVEVLATLPTLWVPPSNFAVTPVLAWWRNDCDVRAVDAAEVASVHRVPLAELLDPAHRFRVRHPSGALGPAFEVSGLLVWGFTAGLLSSLFRLAGWERPWDSGRVEDLPASALAVARRTVHGAPVADGEP